LLVLLKKSSEKNIIETVSDKMPGQKKEIIAKRRSLR